MIYSVRFKLSHGGANSQRRSSVGIHIRHDDPIEADAWTGHIGAYAAALRPALLPSTVIQGVALRRVAADNGGTVIKSRSRPFPMALAGTRVAVADGDNVNAIVDECAVLVGQRIMWAYPALRLRGATTKGDVIIESGEYVADEGSDLLADVTAAFQAVRLAVTGGGGDVVVLHKASAAPDVVTQFNALGVTLWNLKRRSISITTAEKNLEKRKAQKLAGELKELNPTGAALATLPTAVQTQIGIVTDQLHDLYAEATAELKKYIFKLLPQWVQDLAGLFGVAP